MEEGVEFLLGEDKNGLKFIVVIDGWTILWVY